MLTISLYVRLHPDAANTRDAVPMGERWRAHLDVWSVILVFGLVVGGIHLGSLMDSLSMILLIIPIFFPAISALDFCMSPEHLAIWFGILVLIVVEISLITPPVGMNLFVLNAMDRATPMIDTYRPFSISSPLTSCALSYSSPSQRPPSSSTDE